MATREPIINAPRVVVVMIGVFVALHLVRALANEEAGDWLLVHLSLIPARYGASGHLYTGSPWAAITSPFTHMFLHGDVVHLAMNSVWFLAVGTIAARRLGTVRFIVAFAVCGLAGAALFVAANPGREVIMLGASGAISGLMAIALRLMFSADNPELRWLLSRDPRLVPRRGLANLFGDRRAIIVVGAWIGLNLLFALGWSEMLIDGTIAWEAHLGGFLCGLLLMGAIDPGPRASQTAARLDLDG